jgi:hypothetical protein
VVVFTVFALDGAATLAARKTLPHGSGRSSASLRPAWKGVYSEGQFPPSEKASAFAKDFDVNYSILQFGRRLLFAANAPEKDVWGRFRGMGVGV